MPKLTYISHYPEHLKEQIRHLIAEEKLGKYLLSKYPNAHTITSDKALYAYNGGEIGSVYYEEINDFVVSRGLSRTNGRYR